MRASPSNNTSCYDFEKLLADAQHVVANLRNHIAGFSPNMRDVLEKLDFDTTISTLDEAGLLFQVRQAAKAAAIRKHVPWSEVEKAFWRSDGAGI